LTYAHTDAVRLAAPRRAVRTLGRPRLLRRLDRLVPLAVLDVPPGSGATTLLADWSRTQQTDGALLLWLDPRRAPGLDLVRAVVDALGRTIDGAATGGAPSAAHLAALVAATGRRCVVVVDGGALPVEGLGVLVDALALAADLHLVVVTQESGGLVHRAEALGLEVLVVTGDQMAAGRDELADLARSWGHEPTSDVVRRLHAATGGWLLPARLALDATAEGSATLVLDHAVERVRRSLALTAPEGSEHREVLSALSLVRSVDTRGLEALVRGLVARDEPSWFALAERLTRHSLLVRTSGDGLDRWSVPAVVRSCLDEDRVSHRVKDLVARELPALAGAVDLGHLALRSRRRKDWAVLRDLWVSHALELISQHPAATVRAYDGVPEEVLGRMPSLRIAAVVVGAGIDPEDGHGISRRYVRAGEVLGPGALGAAHPDDVVSAVTATLVARRSRGDVEGSVDVARWYADATSRSGSRGRVAPSPLSWFELQWSRTLLAAGDTHGALAAAERAVGLGSGRADCRTQVQAAAGQAALGAALLGSRSVAKRWLAVARRSAVPRGWVGACATLPSRIASALLALDDLDAQAFEEHGPGLAAVPATDELWPWVALVVARHAILLGDPASAVLWLYDGLAQRRTTPCTSTEQRYLLDLCTAHLLVEAGELTRASAVLDTSSFPKERLAAASARLQLFAGDAARARALAEAAARAPETPARERPLLLLVHAAAALRSGLTEEARQVMRSAHDVIHRLGTISAYAYLPADDLARLVDLEPDPADDAPRALEAVRRGAVKDDAIVVLTRRELEVLRQSARHESLAAVARALSVSVNTVKKQRVSLYAKLGVSDRDSAVLRGQHLGLLGP
jgi:LuxR family maltose regulon positive regulatory protein